MPSDPSLSLRWLPDDGVWRRFEITSRGDRVVVRLRAAAADAPRALAVMLSADASAVEPLDGIGTLTFDLPLLGERASPKWTERLSRCLADGPSCPADEALLADFVGQAAHDVGAALDACARILGSAPQAAILGVGPGACVAAQLAEREPRIGAFVLAPAGLARTLDPSARLAAGGRPCTNVASVADGRERVREAVAAVSAQAP